MEEKFYLKNVKSGKILNVYGNETISEGRRVCTWKEENTFLKSQMWHMVSFMKLQFPFHYIRPVLDSSYTIKNSNDKCVVKKGTNEFRLRYSSDNIVFIYDMSSSTTKVLAEVPSTKADSDVIWTSYNGTDNSQKWEIIRVAEEDEDYTLYCCADNWIKLKFGMNGKANFFVDPDDGLDVDLYLYKGNKTNQIASSSKQSGVNELIKQIDVVSRTDYYVLIKYKSGSGNCLFRYKNYISTENYAMYPCKTMCISQNYNDEPTHMDHSKGFSTGDPYDWPFDDNCGDANRSYIYCPCDEMEVINIYGVGNKGVNTIWLRSTSPVKLANGSTDYLVMMVIHPNDDTLSGIAKGDRYTRGQAMFLEGNEGIEGTSYGHHFHISLGLGSTLGNGWRNVPGTPYYVIYTDHNPIKPEDALFINPSFTTVISTGGLTFKNI